MYLDSTAYPTVIRNIIRFSAIPELKAFRCTSRWCCKYVDSLLASHLVLEGELYSDFPRRTATAVLHNGIWGLLFNNCLYHVSTTEDEHPFDVMEEYRLNRETFRLGIIKTPVEIPDFGRARVLDLHGTLRVTVLAGLAPKLPNVHTMRIFDGYHDQKSDGYASPDRTNLWEQQEESDDRIIRIRPQTIVAPPGVKRIVSFHTLVPSQARSSGLSNMFPPGFEELVVNITFNPTQDEWCVWRPAKATLPLLKSATIIFTETSDVQMERTEYHSIPPEAGTPFIESFAPVLGALGVATTVVGMERLAVNTALTGGKSYNEVRTLLQAESTEPITFISQDEYCLAVDENTWELYTNPDQERLKMRSFPSFYKRHGTHILGRIV